MREEGCLYSNAAQSGRMVESFSKPIPSGKPKGHPFSYLNTIPWQLQADVMWSSRQLSFFPSHCKVSGFLSRTCMWGQCYHCYVASMASKSHKCTSQYIHTLGLYPILSFPWAYISFPHGTAYPGQTSAPSRESWSPD